MNLVSRSLDSTNTAGLAVIEPTAPEASLKKKEGEKLFSEKSGIIIDLSWRIHILKHL